MEEIRDCTGKVVCHIDQKKRQIEIVRRGLKTTIQFEPDGSYRCESKKKE